VWDVITQQVHQQQPRTNETVLKLDTKPNTGVNVDVDVDVDKRLQLPRPFMHTTSHALIDSIYDIERKYKPTPKCDKWGGSKYIEGLNESLRSIVHGGVSSIQSFHDGDNDIFFGQNVSVVVYMPTVEEVGKGTKPSLRLELGGSLDEDGKSRMSMSTLKGDTMLKEMTSNVKERGGLMECSDKDYIEYPVMLVDNNVDTNNWWFFLQSILHHYIAVAITQPLFIGDYTQESLRVMHTMSDKEYERSFVDAFDFMYSDRRGRDSRQIWHAQDDILGNRNGIDTKRFCFRKLLWSPDGRGGAKLLINKGHPHSNCFSSIVYSYAAYLKAAVHIPTLPRPDKPRIVWVGRDSNIAANPTSWQKMRIIENQDELITYLREKCSEMGIEVIVADFYGEKKFTAFQEQALFASKANIMIGMHGAGLNMFHFMPFNSVVVEIHTRSTTVQMNSRNFVNHVKEGKYISTSAKLASKRIEIEPIWRTLEQAIEEWYKLP